MAIKYPILNREISRKWRGAGSARTLSIIGALCFGALLVVVSSVRAAGIPAPETLTYTGYLETPAGEPVEGDKHIVLEVFDAASSGSRVCEADVKVTLVSGRFQVPLPESCTDAVKAEPNLWIAVEVDGDSLGRTKLGAVPYAVEAGHADHASHVGGLAGSDLQRRVFDDCPAGSSIRSIAADGTVTCQSDTDTIYGAGSGLALTGGGSQFRVAEVFEYKAASNATWQGVGYAEGSVETPRAHHFCAVSEVVTNRHHSGNTSHNFQGCTVEKSTTAGRWVLTATGYNADVELSFPVRCAMFCF